MTDAPAPAAGAALIDQYQKAGFTSDEINQYRDQVNGQYSAAGFNQDEINQYWGTKTLDMSGVEKLAQETPPKAGALTPDNPAVRSELVGSYERGETKNATEFSKSALTAVLPIIAAGMKRAAHPVDTAESAFGQMEDAVQSTSNRFAGTYAYPFVSPETQQMLEQKGFVPPPGGEPLPPDASTAAKVVRGVKEGVGIGFGAVPLSAAFMPISAPTAPLFNEAMNTAQPGKPGPNSSIFPDVVDIGMNMLGVAGVHHIEGAAHPAPQFEEGQGPWAAAPKAQDFPDAALNVAGTHAEAEVSQVLRNIYAETGIHPAQVAADAKAQPAIAQDLAAGNIPSAYKTPVSPIEQEMADLERQLDSGKGNPEEIKTRMGELADQRIQELQMPPTENATPLPARSATVKNASDSAYQMMSPDEMTLDPQRFQYKASEAGGVTGALSGVNKWEPALANPVTVWQGNDGKTYVVNGHQRYDLANRAAAGGQENVQMPARVFKESDGYTPEYMRALGAYQNIAEGSGTAIDAAKVLRSGALPEDRQLPSLPPKSQLVQQAHGLAALDKDSFGMVVNDIVPAGYAAEVGHSISDPKEQLAAMDVLAKSQPSSLMQARLMVQDIKNSGFLRGDQTSLFGDTQIAQSLFNERSRILDNAIKQLRQLKTAFGTAINQEGALTEAGNKLSRESNEAAKVTNEKHITALQADATRRGPISDALSDAARDLKSGQSVAAVTRQFLDRTRELNARSADQSLRPGDNAGSAQPAQSGSGQSEIPGTDRITDRQLAERKMEGAVQPKGAQKPADEGLFDVAGRGQKSLFQRTAEKPVFYSALEKNLGDMLQTKATPEQWQGVIKNLTQRGVRQEEIDWSGVQDWLKEQKGQVTKQQVMDFLKANALQVEEVVKGTGAPPSFEEWAKDNVAGTPEAADRARYETYRELGDPVTGEGRNDAKFSTWQLPGGENYRELLMTLPERDKVIYSKENVTSMADKLGESDKHWLFQTPDNVYQISKNKFPDEEAARDYVIKEKQPEAPLDTNYKGPHFDENNVVAHLRFNDRIDAAGKKTMFLEEVQSDWHQKGREKGYRDDAYKGSMFENTFNGGKVPDAPFKTSWPELAFKRALRWAVENGYDTVAWTTGEQQAARYDLSKHVDTVQWDKNEDGSYNISGMKDSRRIINKDKIKETQLGDIVGKDLAVKMVKVGQEQRAGTFYGQDLKMGGEGMKQFYDRMLPSMVNKLVKKWDGKVGETEIPGVSQVDAERIYHGDEPKIEDVQKVLDLAKKRNDQFISPITGKKMEYSLTRVAVESPLRKIFKGMERGRSFFEMMKEYGNDELAEIFGGEMRKNPNAFTGDTVHSVDITPEMRDSVMKGQPLFSRTTGSKEVPAEAVPVAPGVAAVAKSRFTAKEAEISTAVNAEVQRLLGGRGITKIAKELYSTGEEGAPGKVTGYTHLTPREVHSLVYVSMESPDMVGTARHEAGHILLRRMEPEERGVLESAADKNGWVEKHANVADQEGMTYEQKREEAIVEEFAQSRRTQFADAPAAVRPIFQKIANLLDAIGDQVRRILGKDTTAQDIFSRMETGEIGTRGRNGDGGVFFQTPEENILDKISVGDKEKRGQPLTWDGFYKAAVDKLDPIRRITDAMQKGNKSDVLNDTYKLMRNQAGNYGRAQQFLEQATYDFKTYKNTGKSLKAILEPVKENLNSFRAYAASRRAIELNDRGINSGMPIADAKQVIAAGAKRFEPIFKELNDYQNSVLKYLKDSGVLTDEQVKSMKGANQSYVPFYRVMDDENFGLSGGAAAKVKNPIMKIKGSDRDIIDPIESIVRNTYSFVSIAEKNAALKSFYDGAIKSGAPDDYFTKQSALIKPTKVSEAEMNAFLQKEGITQMPQDTLTVFRAMRTPLAKDEIGFFDKGKWTVLKVDPDLAEAFNGTPRSMHGLLFKMMALPAKMLRYGLIEPAFIIRHLERNTLSATVIGSKGTIPFENLYKGMFSYFKRDELYENWLKSGGKVSALSGVTRDDVQDEVKRLTDQAPDANFLNKAWNIAKTPFDVIHAAQQSLENINRLGAYKTALQGLAVDKANIIDAGYYSRNIAPDPSRIGAQTGLWNSVTALANTEIQHTAQLIDAFRTRPIPTLAKGFAFITLPTLINWAVNHNSDQYKEAAAWERDAFWIMPVGGYSLRIPKPFFMGFLFATVPERILDAVAGNDKGGNGLKEMVKDMFEQATPNTIPTALTPILEQITNHSMFRGTPLVPDHLMQQLPEYRYSEYTSELTKAVGKLVSYVPFVGRTSSASPVVIDNYLRAWTGTMGTYVKEAADAALRKSGVLPDPLLPASSLADIPFVRAFVMRYPSAQAESIQRFQNDYRDMSMVTNSYKALMKQGQVAQARDLALNNPSAFVKLDSINKALNEQNQLVRALYKNPAIKPDEKRQLIDSTYYQMIQIARAGNNMIGAIKDMPKAAGAK